MCSNIWSFSARLKNHKIRSQFKLSIHSQSLPPLALSSGTFASFGTVGAFGTLWCKKHKIWSKILGRVVVNTHYTVNHCPPWALPGGNLAKTLGMGQILFFL